MLTFLIGNLNGYVGKLSPTIGVLACIYYARKFFSVSNTKYVLDHQTEAGSMV